MDMALFVIWGTTDRVAVNTLGHVFCCVPVHISFMCLPRVHLCKAVEDLGFLPVGQEFRSTLAGWSWGWSQNVSRDHCDLQAL